MPGSLDSIQNHRPLADVVFNKLRDAVRSGTLKAGQWLRQEALAQELGVSQMPVREALKRLVAEGLAERIPYKGVRVVEFTPEDIVDMFTVRLVLEGLAARFAASLITSEDLKRLQENIRQAAQYTRPDQMTERWQLNAEFHLSICRASGRRYLIHQVEMLWRWFPNAILYEGEMSERRELLPAYLERETRAHKAILAALKRRDAQQAEEETRRHIQNLAEELAEILGVPKEVVEPLKTL